MERPKKVPCRIPKLKLLLTETHKWCMSGQEVPMRVEIFAKVKLNRLAWNLSDIKLKQNWTSLEANSARKKNKYLCGWLTNVWFCRMRWKYWRNSFLNTRLIKDNIIYSKDKQFSLWSTLFNRWPYKLIDV